MPLYIQYHNHDKEGLPLGDGHGIHTGLKHVLKATGGQVFLIFGVGKPRRYYLWDTFIIEQVKSFNRGGKGQYHAFGPGWDLAPPQSLEGKEFDAFKESCANFVAFRKIDDLPFAKTLKRLAGQHRQPSSSLAMQRFVENLQALLVDENERQELAEYFLRDAKGATKQPTSRRTVIPAKSRPQQQSESPTERTNGRGKPKSAASSTQSKKTVETTPQMRALSIRQPHAEAILRGIKKIEYRSRPTRIRGRIQIYASLGRYSAEDEAEMMEEYGIDDVACDELARGVLIGTVELVDCDDGDWHLKNPQRATKLVAPKKQPQPVWFNPF